MECNSIQGVIAPVISKSRSWFYSLNRAYVSFKQTFSITHGQFGSLRYATKDQHYVFWYPLRRTVTAAVKCLAQEHNTTSPTALEPRPLDLETSALTRGYSALL